MAWLLDTNAWIDYLKNPDSRIREHLQKRTPEDIVTCSVVLAELFHGARKYGAPQRRLAIVRETLEPYRSYPFNDEAAEIYASLRDDLERKGTRIGPNDLLIASICLAFKCVLVTANEEEFHRIAGLPVENWRSS